MKLLICKFTCYFKLSCIELVAVSPSWILNDVKGILDIGESRKNCLTDDVGTNNFPYTKKKIDFYLRAYTNTHLWMD